MNFDVRKIIEMFGTKRRNSFVLVAVGCLIVGIMIGGMVLGVIVYYYPQEIIKFLNFLGQRQELFYSPLPPASEKELKRDYSSPFAQEEAIIKAVEAATPAVVSIIVSKDVPIYEERWINPFGEFFPEFRIPQYIEKGKQKQRVGAGTGFIVNEEGWVLTNKHVVFEKNAEYTVFLSNRKKYSAKVLALDPAQDLAIVKINSDEKFPFLKLGDSDTLRIGQTVIAIGNALGEFSNTVSVGVVSGLKRTVSASDKRGVFSETLQDIIQTDAAINEGNSGGPLLNLKGEVIGINTAMVEGAENIGFAIPINRAKRAIQQVKEKNKIVYPFLGIRYLMIDEKVKEDYGLSVDYGALIIKGSRGESAIFPGSAAEKAGLKEKDIILEINGEVINLDNSLSEIILKYNPGDKIELKVLRGDKELFIEAILGERE